MMQLKLKITLSVATLDSYTNYCRVCFNFVPLRYQLVNLTQQDNGLMVNYDRSAHRSVTLSPTTATTFVTCLLVLLQLLLLLLHYQQPSYNTTTINCGRLASNQISLLFFQSSIISSTQLHRISFTMAFTHITSSTGIQKYIQLTTVLLLFKSATCSLSTIWCFSVLALG